MENSCRKKVKSSLKFCAIEIVLLCWFVPTTLLLISNGDISQDLVIRLNHRIIWIFKIQSAKSQACRQEESRDFCAVLGRKKEFNSSCSGKSLDFVPVEYIISQYPALKETIEGNYTGFVEKVCKINEKLDEKLLISRSIEQILGEFWMKLWDSLLSSIISGAIIPIFLLIPLALWSDRKSYRKSLIFIPIVGAIVASLGENQPEIQLMMIRCNSPKF